ncbi:MAG TPA: chemotaxis protein CheA [Thermoclostridium caenicola]|uniref:chemotaxis protein CheA n=1 Tax=Thermoclostridium caenicola TaxID=659425 RepID=UPI002CCE3DEF|nr:chemotaxis protein CheA [Thermoclostridium caenicola]HOL85248.1 chemotaxis protein CheA [Thermoclostridium caenicola]HPO75857.1 chemotaxis protein CheA [Thermoclostridium caenicola]
MDMNQYLDIFVEESREHLQSLNSSLLELEKDPADKGVLNEIFRVAHTLKGMSGTMGFTRMQRLTHHMEDVLDALRNDRISANSDMVDILFKCLDALENYVNTIVSTGNEGNEENKGIVDALADILKKGGLPTKSAKSSGRKAKSKPSDEKESKEVEVAQAEAEAAAGSEIGLVELNQYDINVIRKALEAGMNVFQIHVEFDKGCLLKSARAFIVFQILEKNSEIIKSVPKVEDIEDEKFDFEFTVVVVTSNDQELFEREINSVAEIAGVHILPVTAEMIGVSAEEIQETAEKTGGASRPEAEGVAAQTAQETIKKAQKAGKTVRVDIDRLDVLMNLVSELIIIKNGLDNQINAKDSNAWSESIEYLERVTTNLHDAVMKVRMVPVEAVFNRFPRMIRDIARELDKDIELKMSGEETELDRTVIDEIGDPLIHILRNSADHGIETREERKRLNKPPVGSIYLQAYQDGNNVVIEVEDDGRGIDVGKVRKKILEKGLETPDIVETLSEKEVIDYLFKPNFSTADKITDLSGRGVGLDVVKTKIEALGGTVEVETRMGYGSKFIIRLPLTLAIIQALLVKIGSEKYALPLSSIREIDNIKFSDVKMVRNREVIMLRDMVIPLVRLNEVLEVKDAIPDEKKKYLTVVIVKKGDKLSAFSVDSLIGQQEIVIKSLGKIMQGIKCIAGATILGDGNVALIVDSNSIAV